MATVAVELRTDLKCVSGSSAVCDYTRFVSCKITEALDGNGGCTIVVPKALGDRARLRYVLHTTDTVGFVREFRIREISYDPIAATATIGAAPVHADLASGGMIRDLTYGFAVSAVTLTPTQWLQNFVLTNLAADKLTWLSLGVIEPAAALSVTFVGFTRLQLIRALETQTGAEFVLRRTGDTGYVIDMLTAVGSTATQIRAVYGRNLVASDVQLQDDELATVVQPTGDTPANGLGPATIGQNSWRVVSSSGTGPYWVVLADPAGGTNPIKYDSQANPASGAMYVLAQDGTSQVVLGSRASDSAIQVASIAALSANSHCTLLRSATEAAYELDNPTATAFYGRTVRSLPTSGVRGEKNYVANGGFEYGQGSWTMANISLANQPLFGWPVGRTEIGTLSCLTNGANAGGTVTSLAIDGLPANSYIRRWDKIFISPFDFVTTGSATFFDSAGEATVTFTPAVIEAITAGTLLTRGAFPSQATIKNAVSVSATSAVIKHNTYTTPLFTTGDRLRCVRAITTSGTNLTSYTVTTDVLDIRLYLSALPAFPEAPDGLWKTVMVHGVGGSPYDKYVSASIYEVGLEAGVGYFADVNIVGLNGYSLASDLVFSGVQQQVRAITGTINQFGAAGTVTQTLVSAFTGAEYTAGSGVMSWRTSADAFIAGREAPDSYSLSPLGIKHTSLSGTTITIDGLTPTSPTVKIIPVGTAFGYGGKTLYATAATSANSSGAATVAVVSVGTLTAIADNIPVQILRPVDLYDANGGGNTAYRIDTAYNSTPTISTPAAASPSAYIVVPTGGSVYLTASAAITLWNRGTASQTVGATVVLVNKTTNAVVGYATTSPATFSMLAGTYYHAVLRVSATITTTGTYELRALGGTISAGNYANNATYVRWGMLTVGADPNVPYVAGSHANKLWQLANVELGLTSSAPQTLRAKLIDLKRLGAPVGTEIITMGASVLLENVNISGRIVAYTLDLADPKNSEITLSTAPKRLTNFL